MEYLLSLDFVLVLIIFSLILNVFTEFQLTSLFLHASCSNSNLLDFSNFVTDFASNSTYAYQSSICVLLYANVSGKY